MPTEENLEPPSKSARKREAERLQALGRRLSKLSAEQLDALGLPDRLLSALLDYQRFPSREAKRRQMQFIGRLMRDFDTAAVEEHLADLDGQSALARHRFHQLEAWREALLTNPDSLTEFIAAYPHVDRQQLRQLVKRAAAAGSEDQLKKASRTLFRFLRDAVEEEAQAR